MYMPSAHPNSRTLVVAALLAATAGCATRRSALVWPEPPETARIEHIRSFSSNTNLDRGFWATFIEALLPRKRSAVTKSPLGLALSPDEQTLYVACGAKGGVVALDRKSSTLRNFTTDREHFPMFAHGVKADADGNVYVSDRAGAAILVFDAKGGFLRKITFEGMADPSALAIDRKAQILYAIAGASTRQYTHRIEVFSLRGEHLRTLGGSGDLPGLFYFPTDVQVSPEGNLYVVDMHNNRVQLLDTEGRHLATFGKEGTGLPGYLDKAKGLSWDSFGNLYVADSMQGVHIFNPRYQALMWFGAPLVGTPGAIAIDSRNRIFLADFNNNCIHEFQLVNTRPEDSFAPPEKEEAKPGEAKPESKGSSGNGEAPTSPPATGAPAAQ